METRRESIAGAVARGWCSEKNKSKTMDSDLAFAITDEIMKLDIDIEEELMALYTDCTDKQRRLEVLCELHRIRQELVGRE